MKKNPDAILMLPRLKIQNVNLISSPLTWGFPAITAILGFAHALERKINQFKSECGNIKFGGVGVICHHFAPQIFKPAGRDTVFCLTRNPIATKKQFTKFNTDGTPPALVEEGRAHMEISLLIEVYGQICMGSESENISIDIFNLAQTLRVAGGSILPDTPANTLKEKLFAWPDQFEDQQKKSKKIMRECLPGFALVSRQDLFENPKNTILDSFLAHSSLNFEPPSVDAKEDSVKSEWTTHSKPGWIVPIPVGYNAISECYKPGVVLNARDNQHPFQFVESIYSLGQWLSPHRVQEIDHILWHYDVDAKNGLYRCVNDPKDSIKFNFEE